MGYTAFVTSIGDAILDWADPVAADESRYTEVWTKNIISMSTTTLEGNLEVNGVFDSQYFKTHMDFVSILNVSCYR